MDWGSLSIVGMLASLVGASTPILLAALGETVVEKSGVLNLGVEGMMITGAVTGFIAAVLSGNPWIGFIAGTLGGALLSGVFALLTQGFLTNHVATGLALTLFGLGLSAMIGQPYVGQKPPTVPDLNFGPLADIPALGRIVFSHDAMVYISVGLVIAVWYFLNRTRSGLILRAVGENHDAAHGLGYRVVYVRVLAILFGGALAGLGGAYLSLARVPQWTEGMTAGAGWIALAIVVFASWRAGRVLLGAYLFGGITILQLNLQAAGMTLSPAYLSMAPYLMTIIVLVLISRNRASRSSQAPASLGRIFYAPR
ncbi:MAG: ABC transporter permease [Pseudomonadota bacterium]